MYFFRSELLFLNRADVNNALSYQMSEKKLDKKIFLENWKIVYIIISKGSVRFAKNVWAEKSAEKSAESINLHSICTRQFAKSQFPESRFAQTGPHPPRVRVW